MTTRIVLLHGALGAGKIITARQMASELELDPQTSLEVTWVYWATRLVEYGVPVTGAPFRAPHHTVSESGLLGDQFGTGKIRLGEVSLAHGGCLMLDELPEFRRSCVEALGRVLRGGMCLAKHGNKLPAKPALVVACANLCACGWLGSTRPCVCKPDAYGRWQSRLMEYCYLLGVTKVIPVSRPALKAGDP